jgi:hypothetical protein
MGCVFFGFSFLAAAVERGAGLASAADRGACLPFAADRADDALLTDRDDDALLADRDDDGLVVALFGERVALFAFLAPLAARLAPRGDRRDGMVDFGVPSAGCFNFVECPCRRNATRRDVSAAEIHRQLPPARVAA